MKCSACGKNRQTVGQAKSRIATGVEIYICKECYGLGFEPRGLVILVGKSRDGGIDLIKRHLAEHLYHGPDITARELHCK